MSRTISIALIPAALILVAMSQGGWAQSAPVTAMHPLADRASFLAGSDEGLLLYDIHSLRIDDRIESEIEKIYAIESSSDGNLVAVAGGTPGEYGMIEVFSLGSGKDESPRAELLNFEIPGPTVRI